MLVKTSDGDREEGGHKLHPIGGRFGILSRTRQGSRVPQAVLGGPMESAFSQAWQLRPE